MDSQTGGSSHRDNVFVRILAGTLPSHAVYSDEHVYAFLDIFPQAPGHTLVIPRLFSENIAEASEQELLHCLRAVRLLIPALKAATGAEGVTVLSNMGEAAGQSVPYLHFHLIPRSKGSGLSSSPGAAADQQELARICAAIREQINA